MCPVPEPTYLKSRLCPIKPYDPSTRLAHFSRHLDIMALPLASYHPVRCNANCHNSFLSYTIYPVLHSCLSLPHFHIPFLHLCSPCSPLIHHHHPVLIPSSPYRTLPWSVSFRQVLWAASLSPLLLTPVSPRCQTPHRGLSVPSHMWEGVLTPPAVSTTCPRPQVVTIQIMANVIPIQTPVVPSPTDR